MFLKIYGIDDFESGVAKFCILKTHDNTQDIDVGDLSGQEQFDVLTVKNRARVDFGFHVSEAERQDYFSCLKLFQSVIYLIRTFYTKVRCNILRKIHFKNIFA